MLSPGDAYLRLIRLTARQMKMDESPMIQAAHAEELAEYIDALDKYLTDGGDLPSDWHIA